VHASRRRVLAAAGPLIAGQLGAAGAACGLPGQAPPPAQLAPATLTYTTWWVPPGAPGLATEKAIQAYQQKRPHVQVRVEALTDTAARQMEKVQTMAAGGTPPDLSLLRPQGYPAGFAQKGMLLQVDDRLQRDRRAARADFIPVQLERGVWQGKLWGLPAEAWFLVTLYNPALFARAGLATPADTWTWDAWLDAARRVAALPAQDGVRTFGADDLAMWEVLIWAWGAEILNKPETECVLNRPPAPEALQWRADLLTRHGAVPAPADLTGVQNGARGLFEQGRMGMFTVGNWALVDVQTAAQTAWSVAPVPAGRAGRWTLAGGAMYGALRDGKQVDAAWDLLADLVMGDAARVMATESSMLPSLKPMIRPEQLPHYKPEWLRAIQASIGSARQPHYNHPRYLDLSQVFTTELTPVWRGQKAPKDAADEIVRQVAPLLKQAS
jgi:multiple sugar transport system substrate-binding protein